jgi:hypothetical protein
MVVKACKEFLTVRSPVLTNHLLEYKVMRPFILKINAGIRDGVEITQF